MTKAKIKTKIKNVFHFPCRCTVIEIAVGEYDVDLSKLMAAAVKKFHEERDTYYLSTYKRDNFIRADSGTMCQHDLGDNLSLNATVLIIHRF